MSSEKKLFLLDAMALIYRAYFALNRNPRINSRGLNTSAILGFANSLWDVLSNQQPTHIAVAFDSHAPTLRHQEYEDYKANREEIPEDIVTSIPYIKEMLKAFRIPIIEKEGYEADDIIGTLSKKAEEKGFITYMMTPDKDFGQVVTENIFIYKPPRMGNKPEILGTKEICNKYTIEKPTQLIDILGLWGDASDNIPGVPGIGEKRAKQLIAEYGSIDELIKNSHYLKGKIKENIEQYKDQALLSRDLATIILNVPVDFDEKQFKRKDPDFDALKALLNELEFRTFYKRVFSAFQEENTQMDLFSTQGEKGQLNISTKANSIENTEHSYVLIETESEIDSLIQKLKNCSSFCFDTETTGLDTSKAELVGMSFAINPHEACFVYLPEEIEKARRVILKFKGVFEDESIEKTGQNLKFDISMLKWYGIHVKGNLFDTMIAHYLIEPDHPHNMDYLAETYLDYKTVKLQDLIGKKGKNQLNVRALDKQSLSDYAAEDADITLQLRHALEPLLEKTGTLNLFRDVEIPLIPVLASMEAEGVNIDIDALHDFSSRLSEEIIEKETAIFKEAGTKFNIASPKQLGEILFERLKITDNPKRTKTKQYATGEEVLLKLESRHAIVPLILEYRSLTKLKSTYVDALPSLVNEATNRLHTSYNQAVTATGRLSSNNPNLQNIPIRTERGREIRKAFVPRDDKHTLIAADYSQIELRIIASMSDDKNMTEAFIHGQDIHSATAAKIYGISLNDVTSEMRRTAKTVNFGIIYGISAFGLSQRLDIPRREAASIIDEYFRQYPDIKKFMNDTIAFAREHSYVETLLKRRRYLRDINSNNAVVRNFAERNAINAPIQGSAADMIKIAMINIFNKINSKNLKTKMILQVHDELVFDTPRDEAETLIRLIEEEMKNAVKLKVPIEVDINTGNNWLEAH